jgi:hypothetical protein
MISPNDLLPGKINGYHGLEQSAEQYESHIIDVLTGQNAGTSESRKRLEVVRPILMSQTRLLEYYVTTAAAESCAGLVPRVVDVAAHVGTILLAPRVYIPSSEFVQDDDDEQTAADYIHEMSREYLRERPTLSRLVTSLVLNSDEGDPYIRRTVDTVAGFILWQCEQQRYEEFIDIRTASIHDIVKEWDGVFPDADPPHDIVDS